MSLPDNKDLNTADDDYVSLLRANLESPRKTAAACVASKEYQRAGLLIPGGWSDTIRPKGHTNKDFLPSKLITPYKGPYVVLSHYKNDITCKHANVGTVQVFHIYERPARYPRMSISALYSWFWVKSTTTRWNMPTITLRTMIAAIFTHHINLLFQ